LIGNGPYQLTGWSHGERITLKKSPEYRGEAEILPDEVRFYMDADGDPLDLLTSGQLSAAEITAEQAAEPPTGIRVERMNDRIRYLWINNALPLFQSEKLRQSLRDGLEWEILNRQLDGKTAKPAEGYLPPDTTLDGVIYRTGANRLSFTTDSAAGDRFREGLRETGISQPAIALLCADDRASVEYAQYIAQSWQKNLQLFVTLESLAPDVLAARLLVGNYQLAVFPLTTAGDTAAAGLSVFAGTAGEGNLAHYTDDAFIAGCAMLRGGGDTREAAEEWERRLYEACPAVPLAFETRYFGISEKLDGLRIHPFNGGSYGSPYDFYQTEKK
ncbi:MAG: ABC transporter substrate-binding protein, partial [Oscillospiraceae bacterium]|nr:ABC transporter substrate-binding protein [Oscillospiraceae bacterium]